MMISEKRNNSISSNELQQFINSHSYNANDGLDPLFERIGDSRIVLLGEASHGTHEYYIWRARITRRLLEEKGFTIIGVEGDWPDCYQINRYIRQHENSAKEALDVLQNFNRWPDWMWANWEIAALMEWLKGFNKGKAYQNQAGFYGLDVYSLWESLDVIRNYLQKNDPDALVQAENALQCFEPYNREGTDYASSIRFTPESCEDEVVDLLQKVRAKAPAYNTDPESPFNIEQNALTAVNAERYFRAMIGGGPKSWNIRDEHMTDTLERLLDFHGPQSKAVIWEHNTHIGDARATDMKENGLLNVGQLVREKWGDSNVVSVGFGSYKGTVIAGNEWGGVMQKMEVPEARKDSWEDILHQSSAGDKLIITEDIESHPEMLKPLNHRAIGVIYKPDMDYYGNYVPGLIPKRYDAFIYLDETQALHPVKTKTDDQLTPETYPWGF
jgi:erythromycin esterase